MAELFGGIALAHHVLHELTAMTAGLPLVPQAQTKFCMFGGGGDRDERTMRFDLEASWTLPRERTLELMLWVTEKYAGRVILQIRTPGRHPLPMYVDDDFYFDRDKETAVARLKHNLEQLVKREWGAPA